MEPLRVAQIGVGYWGRNVLRNLMSMDDVEVAAACDRSRDVLAETEAAHSGLQLSTDVESVLKDDSVRAVVIATETPYHFVVAEAALRSGKHVFVEKPLVQTVEQAERVVALAEDRDLRLMVGHLLLYHPAFDYVREAIEGGELGDVHYMYSTRVNLGIVRDRENAFESLAPHDLALAIAYLGGEPESVSARGAAYLRPGVEDVVFATVSFSGGRLAHLHTSWLDPHKVRKVTVVGSKRMAVIDDTAAAEKVRIFDKGVELTREIGYPAYPEAMTLRSGDITIPRIAATEPLRAELQHFVDCVRSGATPRTDGRNGLAVVRILEAARKSIDAGGAAVDV